MANICTTEYHFTGAPADIDRLTKMIKYDDEDICIQRLNSDYLLVVDESKWAPRLDYFKNLLDQFYDPATDETYLDMTYYAEEAGNGLFETNDPSPHYNLDVWDTDGSLSEIGLESVMILDPDDLQDILEEHLGYSDDLEKLIKDARNLKNEDGEQYIFINKWDYMED